MRTHTLSGKVPRTTAPAAIVEFLPTVHGPMMIAPPPTQTCEPVCPSAVASLMS